MFYLILFDPLIKWVIYQLYLQRVLWLVVMLTQQVVKESVNSFLPYRAACCSVYSCSMCWLSDSAFSNRVKKLRETLVAVQQLDKNMSSLRSWLAHIETELSRPIVYDTCDDQEIQRKLNQQQASGTTRANSLLKFIDVLTGLWGMQNEPPHSWLKS